jgi:hypothetical protein
LPAAPGFDRGTQLDSIPRDPRDALRQFLAPATQRVRDIANRRLGMLREPP